MAPRNLHLVLGDGTETSLPLADFRYYHEIARRRFEAFVAEPPAGSTAEPCGHCEVCRWNERCENYWDASEHLSLVATITRSQRKKLCDAGVPTLCALAGMPDGTRVPRMQAATLHRLQSQAALQAGKRADGIDRHEVLPAEPGRGFARLPRPNAGDPLLRHGRRSAARGWRPSKRRTESPQKCRGKTPRIRVRCSAGIRGVRLHSWVGGRGALGAAAG